MESARANLLSSLKGMKKPAATTANPAIISSPDGSSTTLDATISPQDIQLLLSIPVLSRVTPLILPKQSTVGDLKELLLRTIFRPLEAVIAPPDKGQMQLWNVLSSNHPEEPIPAAKIAESEEFTWEGPERLFRAQKKATKVMGTMLQPDRSFLVEDHGFKLKPLGTSEDLLLLFDLEVVVHLVPKPPTCSHSDSKPDSVDNTCEATVKKVSVRDDQVSTLKTAIQITISRQELQGKCTSGAAPSLLEGTRIGELHSVV